MKRSHRVVDWFGRWLRTILGAVGALLAFGSAFWVFAVEDDPNLPLWLFIAGLVGTLLAVIMPVWETAANHRKITKLKGEVTAAKREGRAELLLVVNFVIRPLLEKLGTLVRTRRGPDKAVLAAQLKVLALSALQSALDPSIPQLRANYFKLRYPTPNRPILQEPVSTATPPRDRFDLGDKSSESDAILDMLAKGGYVFTADCIKDPPVGFDTRRERAYRAFISAAASDGVEVDGMISVDSPKAGSLTEADATVVRLVANIIAISEAIQEGKKDDGDP